MEGNDGKSTKRDRGCFYSYQSAVGALWASGMVVVYRVYWVESAPIRFYKLVPDDMVFEEIWN